MPTPPRWLKVCRRSRQEEGQTVVELSTKARGTTSLARPLHCLHRFRRQCRYSRRLGVCFQESVRRRDAARAKLGGALTYMSLREVKSSTFCTTYVLGKNLYTSFLQPILMMGADRLPSETAKQVEKACSTLHIVSVGDANGDGISFCRCCGQMRPPRALAPCPSTSLRPLPPRMLSLPSRSWALIRPWPRPRERDLSSESQKQQMDQVVQYVKMIYGIDLFKDVLDRITGFGPCTLMCRAR